MPANPSRVALTPVGQPNQVAPLLLFIIPSTRIVTESVFWLFESSAAKNISKHDEASAVGVASTAVKSPVAIPA